MSCRKEKIEYKGEKTTTLRHLRLHAPTRNDLSMSGSENRHLALRAISPSSSQHMVLGLVRLCPNPLRVSVGNRPIAAACR